MTDSIRYQFKVGEKPCDWGLLRDTWEEAADDAVKAGFANWDKSALVLVEYYPDGTLTNVTIKAIRPAPSPASVEPAPAKKARWAWPWWW